MTDKSEDYEPGLAAKAALGATYVAVLAGIGALIAAGANWLAADVMDGVRPTQASMALTDSQLKQLRGELDRLAAQQAAVRPTTNLPPPLSALDARLTLIEQRQQQIDRAIMDNPSKALELPLMRRDLDALEQRQSASMEALRRNVEQVYDLSKWLIGALAIGILSLALSTLLRRKQQ